MKHVIPAYDALMYILIYRKYISDNNLEDDFLTRSIEDVIEFVLENFDSEELEEEKGAVYHANRELFRPN